MVLEGVPTGKTQSPSQREQDALAALRAYREQSGYVPWDHSDNERLRALDTRQQQTIRAQHEFARVRSGYEARTGSQAQSFETLTDNFPQVTLVPSAPDPDPPLEVKIDPELARVAEGLSRTNEYLSLIHI